MKTTKTTHHGRPTVDWRHWTAGRETGRRKRHARGETLRRIELLEDRRLLAASISIDADVIVQYKGDAAATENLTVSMEGTTYRFASNNDIEIGTNDSSLTITHPGGDPKVVEVSSGMTGIFVSVSTTDSTVDLKSTEVEFGFATDGTDATNSTLTMGDNGDLSGIAARVLAVNAGDAADFGIVVDGSAGPTGGDWTLSKDATSALPLLPTYSLTGFGGAGAVLTYVVAPTDHLTFKNAVGQSNKLTVDFTNGSPLNSGTLNYDGGWTTGSANTSDLVLIGGDQTFANEFMKPSGVGEGEITLADVSLADPHTIAYTGISPHSIYDTVPATFYAFTYAGDPAAGVLVSAGANSADTGNVQTLRISSQGTTPEFTDAHIANKTNVQIYQNAAATGYSITVDYALATPVPGLEQLQIYQSSGPDSASLTGLPPAASTFVYQGAGNDSLSLSIPGTAGAVLTYVNGGNDVDQLTIDAGGLPISAANFAYDADNGWVVISGAQLPGGEIRYQDYENVVVDNIATPATATVTAVDFNAVQGVRLVDQLVGTFTTSSPASASTFGATIAWGDGSTSAGTIVQDASNPTVFYVYGTHTYTGSTSPQTTTLSVRSLPTSSTVIIGPSSVTFNAAAAVSSDDGAATITATELPAPVPTVYGVPIHGTEGRQLVNVLVGAFTAAGGLKASDFSATVSWGDGRTDAGVIVQDASNPSIYYIYGTHTYNRAGNPFTTTITVRPLASATTRLVDGAPVTFFTPAGDPVSQTQQAFIEDAGLSLSVQAFAGVENTPLSSSFQMVVATFTDLGGVDPNISNPATQYTATIYWGDGTAGVGSLNIDRNGVSSQFIVSAAPHTYATPGTYTVTVVVKQADGGATAIASNFAHIADAALTSPSQPITPSVGEGTQFVGMTVGWFNDANPLATTGEYKALVDWGDGTGLQAATVIQPGGPGTLFYVVGDHAYANAHANGASPIAWTGTSPTTASTTNGTYKVMVYVTDTYGSAVDMTNTVTVVDRALSVYGGLDSASDTGVSNTDGVTKDSTPSFTGWVTEGGSIVAVYAALNGGSPTLIGTTTADAAGAWSFTPATALADGGYTISAQAFDAAGHAISGLATVRSGLVIDTLGPKITDVLLDGWRGQVIATFNDYGGVSGVGSGLVASAVRDANNYAFTKLLAKNTNLRPWLATSVTVSPGRTTGEQVATIQFNGGAQIRGGKYLLKVLSADAANLSGIRDVAGNALDGEYYGYFPSGNNINGGNFVAELDAIHHTVYPARTQVGTATPVSPPGRAATGAFLSRDGTLTPSASSAVKLSATRQTATAARAARLAALRS